MEIVHERQRQLASTLFQFHQKMCKLFMQHMLHGNASVQSDLVQREARASREVRAKPNCSGIASASTYLVALVLRPP